MGSVTEAQLRLLLTFRCALREFEHRTDRLCAAVGLSPQHHQLLLAVRGHPGPEPPSVSDLARYLFIRHHSTVGLVNRAQQAGLVLRREDQRDQRVVRVVLAPGGQELVERLAADHLVELQEVAQLLGLSDRVLERLSHRYLGDLGDIDDVGELGDIDDVGALGDTGDTGEDPLTEHVEEPAAPGAARGAPAGP